MERAGEIDTAPTGNQSCFSGLMQIISSSDLDLLFGWLVLRFIAYAELNMHSHVVSKYKEGR